MAKKPQTVNRKGKGDLDLRDMAKVSTVKVSTDKRTGKTTKTTGPTDYMKMRRIKAEDF
jgi:hypothetical protein